MQRLGYLLTILAGIWLTLHSTAATAAEENEPRLYQVEMIIFAYDDAAPEESDLRVTGLSQVQPDDSQPLNAKQPAVLPLTLSASQRGNRYLDTPYTLFPASQRQLNYQRRRIERQSDLRVLFHGAWFQPVTAQDQTRPIHIQAGDQFDDMHELEGYITLSVSRYLHLTTRLYLNEFTSADYADIPLEFLQPGETGADHPVLNALSQEKRNYRKASSAEVLHKRRMRSGETHYLDHPLLGVVVKATPFPPDGEKSAETN